MSETDNIAKMSNLLADDLFSEFFWTPFGPRNRDWDCVNEGHAKKTHPSDVVFYYDNPYSESRTYVTCDLKSYARGTIQPFRIHNAAAELARSLACAEQSPTFQAKYLLPHITAEICGLLFIYNHDGEYDQDFQTLLAGIEHKMLDMPKRTKLVIFGPGEVYWLNNVRSDIRMMRGSTNNPLPSKEKCRFHYPDLVLKKNVQPSAKAATLEMLTGPWIVLEYEDPASNRRNFLIYLRSKGEGVSEYIYLIDCLLHYQMLEEGDHVLVKSIDVAPDASVNFVKAKTLYIESAGAGEQFRQRLERITFGQFAQVIPKFSVDEIGMRDV